METATIEIVQNGNFKNIELKEKLERKGGNIVIKDGKVVIKSAGIPDGQCIVVTKRFADAKKIPTTKAGFKDSYIAGLTYEGEDVSAWLNEKEAKAFNECGGVGDKVRIRMTKETKINLKTGVPFILQVLAFEKLE